MPFVWQDKDMRNISRIPIPKKRPNVIPGWRVRFSRKGKRIKLALFYDKDYGGKEGSLTAAKLYRDYLKEEAGPQLYGPDNERDEV